MATVTPNFNWPVPTSTDLVKDGATAIEALGDSIDASLVDLKGGTSGQVLSKNSNTDMDFVWVTSDDANAIQNTIVDAKGDLITATAADTPARLAVGSNGETLVADSSASVGLRYSATPSASNPILNAACEIAQRGTTALASNAATNQFMTDRWQVFRAVAGATFSRQNTNDTTNLPNIRYCVRLARDSGNTATNGILFAQNVETINSIPFAGKTVTLSFYARAGANYSASGSALQAVLQTGTGTDQNLLSGYAGTAYPINSPVTLTTTWQRFNVTGTLAATTTEIGIYFQFTPTGTAGANDYFEITGVQLDIGSVALPFRTYAATIQGELSACQRYYYRNAFNGTGNGNYLLLGVGQATSTTGANIAVSFPVTMRNEPQAVDFAGLAFTEYSNSILPAITSMSIYLSRRSANLCFLQAVASGASLTVAANYYLSGNGSGTSYVGFSAEL